MARSHSVLRAGGIGELRSRLPEIMAKLPDLGFDAAMQIAQETAEGATERVAVLYEGDFGIEAKEVEEGSWLTGNVIGLSGGAQALSGKAAGVYADWYWFFNEFGTSHQPARPFMIPAFEAAYSNGAVPSAAEELKKGLEGFGI